MNGTELLWQLLQRVESNTRLVLIGDDNQLPPVSPGAPFRDLIESGKVPVARLSSVHRYDEDGPIGLACQSILKAQIPMSATKGVSGFHRWNCGPRSHLKYLIRGYGRALEVGFKIPEIAVLCGYNNTVDSANRELKRAFNPNSQIGDPVVCRRNNYDYDIFNGDCGVMIGKDMAEFNGSPVPSKIDGIKPGWARTIWTAQGGQYPFVFVMLEGEGYFTRQMLYTAVSRCGGASKAFCVLIGPNASVADAIQRLQPPRFTLLREMLRGERTIPNGSVAEVQRDDGSES